TETTWGCYCCSSPRTRRVSNQEDSSHRLHQRRLYEPLWPRNLGITDHCQYRSQSDRSQPGELPRGYERDFLLSLRYSAPALERPHGLIFIEGVSDTKPGTCSEPRVSCVVESRRLISHGLNLTSVYSHYQSDSKQPEVTTCTSNSCLTVDYIFFSSQTQGGDGDGDVGLRPQARLSLLSEEDLWTANGLPNGTCSSDHLCLLARFGLEPRGQ
uniref:Endonuclease/exonuclease/phosphatase domain-containing protein n=1 Tax=Callorhinchus milii TaxID=7868 RepID=A0A4W3I520_CALMI